MPTPKRGIRAFTDQEIGEIKARIALGESQASISRRLRVSTATIGRIARGETYVDNPRVDEAAQPVTPLSNYTPRTPEQWAQFAKSVQDRAELLGPTTLDSLKDELTDGDYSRAKRAEDARNAAWSEAERLLREGAADGGDRDAAPPVDPADFS